MKFKEASMCDPWQTLAGGEETDDLKGTRIRREVSNGRLERIGEETRGRE